jgi:heme exporter protein CcmD
MSPHTPFILGAYLLTLLVVGGVALAIVLDYRALRRALSSLPPREGDEPRS